VARGRSPRVLQSTEVHILFFARLNDFNRKKRKICELFITVRLSVSVMLTKNM
jgi:hypothetical protein